MALIPYISKENETSNYKSNIYEGKNKSWKTQRFTFISNTKSNHRECGCVLYLLSIHGFHVHVQGACTREFVCVEAAEQPWWLFLRCHPTCILWTRALYWPATQCLCQTGQAVSLSLALQFFSLSSGDICACRQVPHQPSQFFTNSPSYPVLQTVLLNPQFTEYLQKPGIMLCHLFDHCTFLSVK